MMMQLTNFILTEWIWSITGGFSYIPINVILLFLLLKLWDHLHWLRAFALSIVLTVGSFLIFFGLVYAIVVKGLGAQFVLPEDVHAGAYDILNTSLILAAIYSGLQGLILIGINRIMPLKVWRAFLCVLAANGMSALLVYKIMFNT